MITVSEKEDDRSDEQQKRLWVLYKSIGDHLGYTKDEIHILMGYKFLRRNRTINGENIETIQSTTKLSVKSMLEYQQNIEIWASQMGWGGLEQR